MYLPKKISFRLFIKHSYISLNFFLIDYSKFKKIKLEELTSCKSIRIFFTSYIKKKLAIYKLINLSKTRLTKYMIAHSFSKILANKIQV